MYMSKKQRWKWSDGNSNEPVERSPIHAKPEVNEQKEEPLVNCNSPDNI